MASRIWKNFVCGPLLTWPTQVSNIFGARRGRKYTKNGLAMGVTIGVDAAKSGKNTHLLVIMRVRREGSQPVDTRS